MICVKPADDDNGIRHKLSQLFRHGFRVGIFHRTVQRVIRAEQAIDKLNDCHARQSYQLLQDQVENVKRFAFYHANPPDYSIKV
jgi:hypothetical protein